MGEGRLLQEEKTAGRGVRVGRRRERQKAGQLRGSRKHTNGHRGDQITRNINNEYIKPLSSPFFDTPKLRISIPPTVSGKTRRREGRAATGGGRKETAGKAEQIHQKRRRGRVAKG